MYLSPFSKIYNSYKVHINSCAYFADTQQPMLHIKTYPDIVWIGHFQYNTNKTEMSHYFHNKTYVLMQGITQVLNEIKNSPLYKIASLFVLFNPATKWIVEEVIFKYVEEETNSYFYGIHTYHNREIEKMGQALSLTGIKTDILQANKYARYAAALVIYSFFCIGVLFDLLMVYLTRGRNIPGKIKKIAKATDSVKKTVKKLQDENIEIIPPAIAINAGMYYKKQFDGRLALVYEANVKAEPLLQIDFKREFNLIDLLQKGIESIANAFYPKESTNEKDIKQYKKNNEKIVKYFSGLKETINIEGILEVKGRVYFEHHVQYNFLTNSYTFADKAKNLIANTQTEFIIKDQVNFNAKISGELRNEFTFTPFNLKVDGKLDVELKGAAGCKINYGVNTGAANNTNFNGNEAQGLFISPTIYCSGIEGTYIGKLEVYENILGKVIDIFTGEEPTKFVLVEPFELPLSKIQLFNTEQ